jgi:hypothetical protein
MDGVQGTTEITPCGNRLPELEIPMINTMVTCLGSEHRRLDEHILPLALAATRLAREHDQLADQAALEVWDEIHGYLFSHLQIEDALVFSWGRDHQAISTTVLDTLRVERQEMRRLIAGIPALRGEGPKRRTATDRGASAQRLLALARTLERHIARYDREVLPSIHRALFK